MENLFVGRQPILDSDRDLYSFELLYREGQQNAFPDVNPEIATIKVLVNTYLSPGFEQIAAKKTFINFSEQLLMTNIFDTLNPKQVVIEILEDVQMTPILLERLKKLKEDGFQLALDDFVLEKQFEEFPELFHLIDYIKVDFLLTTREERAAVEALKNMYPHLILLAEKIETLEQFEEAKKVGYELFQGYFFAKPDIIQSAKLPAELPLYFELMNLLNEKDPSLKKIADVIMKDVSLTYKLLKHTNTYIYQSREKISSVKQAIMRIGLGTLKKWVQFLIVYQEDAGELNGQIKVLTNHALVRAKLCELLARHKQLPNVDEYYMLGMFSLMDLILQREKEEVFPMLPVSAEIIATLCGEKTEMTSYLEIATLLEERSYDAAIGLAEQLGVEEKELSKLALQAATEL